jgi:predicted Zn finger-like uncharacterized protein
MLIVCPTCTSEYTIADDRLGPNGRVVRCATCRGAWFVPPLEKPAEAAGWETSPAAAHARDAAASGPRRRGGSRAGAAGNAFSIALCLALVAAIGMAVLLRSAVVRAVPQSATVFAALGLPVNLIGLQLGGITSELAHEAGGPVLLVSGEIANDTSRPLGVPPLALTIEGEAGELLYSWSDRTDRGEVAPADKLRFQARLTSPPPEGRRVVVSFSHKTGTPAVASR